MIFNCKEDQQHAGFGPSCHRTGRHHHRGGPWGKRGFEWGGAFGPPTGRRFARGDLKYVVLDLLQEGPRHGYDIIRALEERFHGLYSPSPGSVYPTLQLLEDQGFVKSAEQDGKRVYTITDEGRAFLTSRRDTMEDVRAKMAGWAQRAPADIHALADEVRQLGQMLFRQAAHGALRDPETIQQLREAVARARADIEAIFARGPEPPENVV